MFVSLCVQERSRQRQREAVPASVGTETPPSPPPRPIVLVRAVLCFVSPAEAGAAAMPVESRRVEAAVVRKAIKRVGGRYAK